MQAETFLYMHGLLGNVELGHPRLRPLCRDDIERARLDELVKTTAKRARLTIALYEERPLRERAAIGAMYEACEAGLATLALLGSLHAVGDVDVELQNTIHYLQQLISMLFEWAIPLAAPPTERAQR